ncbi:unnamed protein product [Spirodela intermedia]|uniref:BRX domain-containing protein n=1 Tax=Spirodela intermedia TaxID=51605 RepID=A0A7I8IGS8_SPIIN|nr:unnamed protein product [Spirodela intermedia]CAA6656615.1 unnamed protein product [Spirodela intermedia]
MFRCIPCLNTKGFLENLTFHVKEEPYDEHGPPQTASTVEVMEEATERLKKKRREKKKKQMMTGDGGAKGGRVVQESERGEEEDEEWVAEVDRGVLLTLVSLPQGGNRIEKIRFRKDMFDFSEAHRWWNENCDKVLDLYCVHPPSSQPDQEACLSRGTCSYMEWAGLLYFLLRLFSPFHMVFLGFPPSAPSEIFYIEPGQIREGRQLPVGGGKLHGIPLRRLVVVLLLDLLRRRRGGAGDAGGGAGRLVESVVEDQPGVFLIVRCSPDGGKELRRVLFSCERFGEVKARVWWEENKMRLHGEYTLKHLRLHSTLICDGA